MHIPYEQRLKHPCDFRVEYKFYSKEEGGRERLPFQGIRSDFWYEQEGHNPNSIFIIWPEFEDEKGQLILEDNIEVPEIGTARMWIINDKARSYHIDKIKVGTIGYFREGTRSTAKCSVIEIVGLLTNPQS